MWQASDGVFVCAGHLSSGHLAGRKTKKMVDKGWTSGTVRIVTNVYLILLPHRPSSNINMFS